MLRESGIALAKTFVICLECGDLGLELLDAVVAVRMVGGSGCARWRWESIGRWRPHGLVRGERRRSW